MLIIPLHQKRCTCFEEKMIVLHGGKMCHVKMIANIVSKGHTILRSRL